MSKSRKDLPPRTFEDLSGLLDHVLDLRYFDPNEKLAPKKGQPVIPVVRTPGKGNFLVIVGENASGKSLIRRIFHGISSEAKIEFMGLSMEGRGETFGGLRGMVYGDESYRSTGENSAHTVLMGIKTCQGRDTSHVIFWDEPDIGLSDSWAAGMGVALRDFALDLPKTTLGAVIVTHSRALVEQLLPAQPHYLHVGSVGAPPTLEAWLARPIVPGNLSELPVRSHERFLQIHKIQEDNKKS